MKGTAIALLILMSFASAASADGRRAPFQKVVDRVDMEKFLGSWYVVGVMPTPFEKGAENGIETYSLDDRGNVRVEYVFYRNGKKVVMRQKGWIIDKESNAEWKVQPLWPFKLPYLIIDLAEDYRYTAIGTDNFDYVWIMSRDKAISEADYSGIISRLAARGYAPEKIQRMKQAW